MSDGSSVKADVPKRGAPDNKFEELILFLCQRSLTDGEFDAIKLNRLLFFADFAAYANLGRAITGEPYQKLESGPAPRRIAATLRELQEAGDLALAEQDRFGWRQFRGVALRSPALSQFGPEEIALVTELIDHFWEKSATEMSRLSDEFDGWKIAYEGETIPYEVALLKTVKATAADKQLSESLREKLRATMQESV
ncbi:MAG: Panacea domain-containing protein [Pirellulaceae bacterium]